VTFQGSNVLSPASLRMCPLKFTGTTPIVAAGICAALHRNSILFPARGTGGPRRYDSLTKSVTVFVKNSGTPSFSARDLRRTFKTLAGSMGIPLEMRNRLQGHALVDVGSVYYDRYDYLDQKREAMEQWILGLIEIIGSGNDT